MKELDMKTRKKLTAVKSKRYKCASKKQKTQILDEFVAETGFNRKYAVHLLANCGKTKQVTIDGKTVKLTALKPKKPKRNNGGRPRKYGDDVIAIVGKIWYPSIKIVGKERLENDRYKKDYDVPKTPYRRLLESQDLSNEAKDELFRRAALDNPISLKRLENRALAKLLKL